MKLEQENETLRQKLSQLQQMIDSGTTLVPPNPDQQSRSKNAGRRKKEINTARFRDALNDDFNNMADQIIGWIKEKIAQLNTDQNYCADLTGNSRFVAPMYVTIQAGVYTPRNADDARPVLEGSSLERFFGMPEGSYSKYSKRGSFRPGEIQALTNSFKNEVLNSAN